MWNALQNSLTAAMGANKTYQSTSDNRIIVGESDEYKRLRHAVEKAHGDRERAIRNVCRLYGVSRLELLPSAIRAATLALITNRETKAAKTQAAECPGCSCKTPRF